MFKVLVNYNFTPNKEWLGDDYLIFDRSDLGEDWLKDFPQEKIVKTANIGNVDYDKLTFLVDYYDDLPEVFLWGKTNLFKYITPEEYEKVKDNKTFTPLLTLNHHIYSDAQGQVNYYQDGMYWERNNSWYTNVMETRIPDYPTFAEYLQLPNPLYLPFPPGGNFILTKEVVHKYSRDFYDKMRELLPYCQLPAEAHMCERSYYNVWK